VAALIDGRQLAGEGKVEVRCTIEAAMACGGHRPGLAVVNFGDDPVSAAYIRGEPRRRGSGHSLPRLRSVGGNPEAELLALVDALNRDARVPARQFRSNRINAVWPDPE